VADLQRVLPHDDALNEHVQEPLFLGQRGLVEPAADALAKRLQVRQGLPGRAPLGAQACLLVPLRGEGFAPAGQLLPALLELGQVDDLRLVGVEQALLFAVQPPQPGRPLLVLGAPVGLPFLGFPGEGLELSQERDGVVEQPLDVLPNGRVEFLDLGLPLGTGAVPVTAHAVPAVAAVVAPPRGAIGRMGSHAEHGQAARPAGQQAAEQVVMAGVVAEGQDRVAGDL